MLPVKVQNNRVQVGARFSVSCQRTDRVGELTQRPVSRGQLPVRLTSTLLTTFDTEVGDRAAVVVPLDEVETVWLGFSGESSRRVALKIRQEEVNAVTGGDWDEFLHYPQDYLVPPDQTSWYGIALGDGHLRQFSRDPIELVVYEPKEPIDPPAPRANWQREFYSVNKDQLQPEAQFFSLVADPHGLAFWSSEPTERVSIYFVDSERWKSLTGEAPPSRKSGYSGIRLP